MEVEGPPSNASASGLQCVDLVVWDFLLVIFCPEVVLKPQIDDDSADWVRLRRAKMCCFFSGKVPVCRILNEGRRFFPRPADCFRDTDLGNLAATIGPMYALMHGFWALLGVQGAFCTQERANAPHFF